MEMFFVVNQDRTADKAAGFYEAQKTQNVYLAPFPSPDLGGGKSVLACPIPGLER